MKLRPSDMRLPALLIAVLSVVLISGCARTPQASMIAPVRGVTIELNLAAPIDDSLYYYMVIDAEGGGQGPVPVFPGSTPGLGWVTGSATHFVEYHGGQFTIYKFVAPGQFLAPVQVGTPIRFSAQGQTLGFTVDLNDLAITSESVDVNFITTDNPLGQPRTIDALIEGGASTLNLDITRDNTVNSMQINPTEQPDDLRNHNGVPVPVTDPTRPLDMTGWSITIDI